jgi:hypothetical protein
MSLFQISQKNRTMHNRDIPIHNYFFFNSFPFTLFSHVNEFKLLMRHEIAFCAYAWKLPRVCSL